METSIAEQSRMAIEWNYHGQINDGRIEGRGLMTYLPSGSFEAQIAFSEFPPEASCNSTGNSLITIACASLAKEVGGTMNTVSLSGGNYEGYRSFICREPSGETVGAVIIALRMRRADQHTLKATAYLSGLYRGPAQFVDSIDYDLPLRQIGKGRIGGEYAAASTAPDGAIYTIAATTEYVYIGERILPFDEVMKVRYSSIGFEREGKGAVLRLAGSAIMLPLR